MRPSAPPGRGENPRTAAAAAPSRSTVTKSTRPSTRPGSESTRSRGAAAEGAALQAVPDPGADPTAGQTAEAAVAAPAKRKRKTAAAAPAAAPAPGAPATPPADGEEPAEGALAIDEPTELTAAGAAAVEEADAEDFTWDEEDEESEALRQARKDAELTASADSVRAYLKQIGKVALLNAEEEVDLAKRIEAGLYAAERLRRMEEARPQEDRPLSRSCAAT